MRFSGKVALVSGAGSGIGRATARAFLDEGARVVLLGRTLAKLEESAAGFSDRALAITARHEDPIQVQTAVRRTVDAFGRLDILVNCAGTYSPGTAGDTPKEVWDESLATNLTGPYVLTREALPHLRRERGGVVINVSSTLGLKPTAGAAAYCAAKAGLLQLTRATALEESPRGVRVNAVCPGVVDTPIHRQRAGEDTARITTFLEQMARLHPIGRVGRSEEIAALILFLASDASSWTTGAIVTIDGGISLA